MKHKISEDIFWALVNDQCNMVKSGFNDKQKERLDAFLVDNYNSQLLYVLEVKPIKLKITIQSNMETIHFWLWKKLSLA